MSEAEAFAELVARKRAETEAALNGAAPLFVALVRDADGKPCIDLPLAAYPAHIRKALEAQMTPEEIALHDS